MYTFGQTTLKCRFSFPSIHCELFFFLSQFLGQVQTVYQLSHDIDVHRFQTLIECLTGTFEEVKILAFDLLMKLPKTVVQFQVLGLFLCKCKCGVCMKTFYLSR